MLEKILKWYPEDDLVRFDGLDDGIIGIDMHENRLIYSKSKCVNILSINLRTEEDVHKFFNEYVATEYHGVKTPIICLDDL